MRSELSLELPPEEVHREDLVLLSAARELGIDPNRITGVQVLRRSLDARGRNIRYRLTAVVWVDEAPKAERAYQFSFKEVSAAQPIVIVGAGPAGLFAALRLLELGLKPIVLERGKDVRARRRDLAVLNREGIVNPDSNYCFGEGGAGTYSDGKLYTRSTKRGDIFRILNLFTAHGADSSILVDAHPHIGTNRLPGIVQAMTETIRQHGGEVHFDTRVIDILLEGDACTGVRLADGTVIHASAVVLATGHSARDIFELLHKRNILLEAKAFALGVRAEHPQALIDSIQYHCNREEGRGEWLPAASYSLTTQAVSRGVFSFCMCPGGIIAPAATAPGEIVVNGWSPSKRNNPFANSGMVVSVEPADFVAFQHLGPLAGLAFQQSIEQAAWRVGGGQLRAPAQRMTDFLNGRASSTLPECSYQPGLTSANLRDILPKPLADALADGLRQFGRKMKGYVTEEAVLVAPESRTSSPVRIPRDRDTLQHPQIKGLFPCAEGAGYAGGIVSAAMDGERCAEMAAMSLGVSL